MVVTLFFKIKYRPWFFAYFRKSLDLPLVDFITWQQPGLGDNKEGGEREEKNLTEMSFLTA